MDGVNPISLGSGAIRRVSPLVGCAVRVRLPSQPDVSVHNGSRLGRGRRCPALGHPEPPKMELSCHPDLLHCLVFHLLDRESLLSIRKTEPAFFRDRVVVIFSGDDILRTA